MFKTTLIAALTALSLGSAVVATVSPASAGCDHSYESAYDSPSYGYDHGEDPNSGGRYDYGDRRSGYDRGNRYGDRRSYGGGRYDNGGY